MGIGNREVIDLTVDEVEGSEAKRVDTGRDEGKARGSIGMLLNDADLYSSDDR